MSSALAIAAVTAVLRDLLNNGVIDRNLVASVGDVTVSALPPDRIPADQNETSRLNLFMYYATPNHGWHNVDLPSWNGDGARLSNPPLALDLHYLLSAYGAEDLHTEILLGYAMQLIHETPVLTRAAIQAALTPSVPVAGGGVLPPALAALSVADLADQVESIKITPQPLNMEEQSRLWTAFQAHYRPTVAYLVSVVLIESALPVLSPKPVLERRVFAIPLQQPVLDSVSAQPDPRQLILAQSSVLLRGSQLSGDLTAVQFSGVDGTISSVSPTAIQATLPPDLSVGAQGAQVVQSFIVGVPPEPQRGVESNVAAFVLHPAIERQVADPTQYDIAITNVQGTGSSPRSATVTVRVRPVVRAGQRGLIELLQAGRVVAIFNAMLVVADTATLIFSVTNLAAGSYVVRVRVDGAESPLDLNAAGQPIAPQVTIP